MTVNAVTSYLAVRRIGAVAREERDLVRTFGASYLAYRAACGGGSERRGRD
jgi:hypothetical protein